MDLRKLKTLIDLVSESNVSELEITEAEGKVRIVKGGPPAAVQMVQAPVAVAQAAPVAAAPADGANQGGLAVGIDGGAEHRAAIEQAGLTLDRIQALEDREQLALVSDRERIARDLHDVVIQRLFATGLSLNRLVGTNTRLDEASAARIETAILDLDTTIAEIRTTIHELNNAGEGGVRHSV